MTKVPAIAFFGGLLLATGLVLPALAQMGCGMMDGRPGGGMMNGCPMMAGMARHMFYMRNGVPPVYRGQTSSLTVTPSAIQEGGALYAQQCAACHGPRGFGDGEAGRGLQPPPANLASMIRMPMLNDEFLLWTVSEGGVPLGTAMPAFKGVLTPDQIWKIAAFMRAGFPPLPKVDEKAQQPTTPPR
jgi:mono/diheme cytochrome c family protein